RMLIEELMPLIEKKYRTAGAPAIGGSSLGGLVSLYLGLTTDIFSGVAAMSPSVWWNQRAILRIRPVHRPRIWLHVGGREGVQTLHDARDLRDWFRANGWTDRNLRYYEDRRGDQDRKSTRLNSSHT